jgi:hypothetical protein
MPGSTDTWPGASPSMLLICCLVAHKECSLSIECRSCCELGGVGMTAVAIMMWYLIDVRIRRNVRSYRKFLSSPLFAKRA